MTIIKKISRHIFFLRVSIYTVCRTELVSKKILCKNLWVLRREKLLNPTFLLFEVLQGGLEDWDSAKLQKNRFAQKYCLTLSRNVS